MCCVRRERERERQRKRDREREKERERGWKELSNGIEQAELLQQLKYGILMFLLKDSIDVTEGSLRS